MVANYKEILYENEVLAAERVTLRKFTKDDADDVLEYASDAETLKYLVWDGIQTRVEATHYIGNVGSGKVMAKCGMEKEGVCKRAVKITRSCV